MYLFALTPTVSNEMRIEFYWNVALSQYFKAVCLQFIHNKIRKDFSGMLENVWRLFIICPRQITQVDSPLDAVILQWLRSTNANVWNETLLFSSPRWIGSTSWVLTTLSSVKSIIFKFLKRTQNIKILSWNLYSYI